MDTIKQAAQSVSDTISQQTSSAGHSEGEFAPTSAYKPYPQTQVDRNVGLQSDMEGIKPLSTEQEGEYGFESYKAAGKLAGKKTIVTGGDSGIGRAAAVMYALEGADVAIVYLPEEQVDAEETKRLIVQAGQECLLLPQDIREEEGCKRVIQAVVDKWGRIDVLVNNASVMYNQNSIGEVTTEQFDRTMKTNVYGTFFLTRAAVPHMPKGSAIITTSSQVAFAGPPTLLDYSMTKGAQIAMTRVLSNQLLSKGIRVNAVCPGPVWTPLQPAAMDTKTLSEWTQTPAPIGRIGQPSELGPAYVWLASSEASFISGQSIHVNGGAMVSS